MIHYVVSCMMKRGSVGVALLSETGSGREVDGS